MKDIKPITFDSAGKFLLWWFQNRNLQGKALKVFERYYVNYYKNFDGYLMQSWSDRHLELDNELDSLGKKLKKLKIMDLGCGIGSISLYIAGKLKDQCDVMGIDINKNRLYCALERQKVLERELGSKINCKYLYSNILDLDENNKYDLIYLEETLHHLEPRVKVIRKICSLLEKGGVLILSEVNALNPVMQLYLLRKRGFNTIQQRVDDENRVIFYGVERIMTAKKATEMFMAHGLNVKSFRYFRITSSKLGKLAERYGYNIINIEKILCKIPLLKSILSVHYNIVLEK